MTCFYSAPDCLLCLPLCSQVQNRTLPSLAFQCIFEIESKPSFALWKYLYMKCWEMEDGFAKTYADATSEHLMPSG